MLYYPLLFLFNYNMALFRCYFPHLLLSRLSKILSITLVSSKDTHKKAPRLLNVFYNSDNTVMRITSLLFYCVILSSMAKTNCPLCICMVTNPNMQGREYNSIQIPHGSRENMARYFPEVLITSLSSSWTRRVGIILSSSVPRGSSEPYFPDRTCIYFVLLHKPWLRGWGHWVIGENIAQQNRSFFNYGGIVTIQNILTSNNRIGYMMIVKYILHMCNKQSMKLPNQGYKFEENPRIYINTLTKIQIRRFATIL